MLAGDTYVGVCIATLWTALGWIYSLRSPSGEDVSTRWLQAFYLAIVLTTAVGVWVRPWILDLDPPPGDAAFYRRLDGWIFLALVVTQAVSMTAATFEAVRQWVKSQWFAAVVAAGVALGLLVWEVLHPLPGTTPSMRSTFYRYLAAWYSFSGAVGVAPAALSLFGCHQALLPSSGRGAIRTGMLAMLSVMRVFSRTPPVRTLAALTLYAQVELAVLIAALGLWWAAKMSSSSCRS